MIPNPRINGAARVAALGMVAAALWAAGTVSPARACSTPVFRYAMYNWAPAPYYVFYFHPGQVAKEDEAINKTLDGLAQAEPPANVVLAVVDTSKEEEFKRLPKVVREAYQSRAEGRQPTHLVYSPWVLMSAWMSEQYAAAQEEQEREAEEQETKVPEQDGPETADTPDEKAGPPDEKEEEKPDERHVAFPPLFAGRLDQKTFEAMVDSPVRRQLGDLLKDGNAAVLLILTGPDEEANKVAEKESAKVVAMAAGGEFPVSGADAFPPGQLPPDAPEGAPAKDSQGDDPQPADSPNNLELAVLKLSRTDPAEKWLVDTLLSIEPDLHEDKFAKSAMVFAVYGRGRAMPPYVGQGITADNLAECVMFLCGPCSCMIKDQNPGSDLLVRRDWDAVAEALATEDPEFSGGEFGYQEFAPNESGDWTQASAADADPAETQPVENPEPTVDNPPKEQKANPKQESAALRMAQRTTPQPETEASDPQAATDGSPPTDGPASGGGTTDSFALRQTWIIGAWVGLAAVVVLAAGFVLILRQRP